MFWRLSVFDFGSIQPLVYFTRKRDELDFLTYFLGVSEKRGKYADSAFSFVLLSRNNLFCLPPQTHENREHLVMMEKILGPISQHMIRKTR